MGSSFDSNLVKISGVFFEVWLIVNEGKEGGTGVEDPL